MFKLFLKSFRCGFRRDRFLWLAHCLGFAIGFTLCSIIFAYVHQAFRFDNFHRNADRIYRIHGGGYGVTPLGFTDMIGEQVPGIAGTIRFHSARLRLNFNDEVLDFGRIYFSDPDLFHIFSFDLIAGDPGTVLNAPNTIVISRSKAGLLFGDEAALGKSLESEDGTVLTVTGVMEDIPVYSHIRAEAFVSLETHRLAQGVEAFDCGSYGSLSYLHLEKQASAAAVEEEVNRVLAPCRMEFDGEKIRLKLAPLKQIYFDAAQHKYDGSPHGNLLVVLLYAFAAALILVIVSANYINLAVAGAAGRVKEMALRKIHGASRSQLRMQGMLEALGIALISYLLALLFIALFQQRLCLWLHISSPAATGRWGLYLAGFAAAILLALLSGLFPGRRLAGMVGSLSRRDNGAIVSGGIQRRALLIIQLMIVVVMLNATFIIAAQISHMTGKDPGFRTGGVITLKIEEGLEGREQMLKERLMGIPGVEQLSFSDLTPGEGYTRTPMGPEGEEKLCYICIVDPDFAELYELELVEGRSFSWVRPADMEQSCMLNEAACRAFGLEEPIGQAFGPYRIIGIIRDFHYASMHEEVEPLVIRCGSDGRRVQIRVSDAFRDKAIPAILKECRVLSPELDPDPVFLSDRLAEAYKSENDLKHSFRFYSGIALLLALFGLSALTLIQLRKRNREILMRRLSGAGFGTILWIVGREQVLLLALAHLPGIPCSYLLMKRWLQHFYYRIDIGAGYFLLTLVLCLFFILMIDIVQVFRVFRASVADGLRDA